MLVKAKDELNSTVLFKAFDFNLRGLKMSEIEMSPNNTALVEVTRGHECCFLKTEDGPWISCETYCCTLQDSVWKNFSRQRSLTYELSSKTFLTK